MALILRKPEEEEPNMFRFLDPFSPIVWLCTVMAVSVSFFLGERVWEWEGAYWLVNGCVGGHIG